MHTPSVDQHCCLSIAISPTGSRGQRLTVHSARGQKPSEEYRKVQSWDPFCLIYTCMVFSCSWRRLNAENTTIYACGPNIENVIMHLENNALKITKWFPNNFMTLNEDKCHLMIFGAKGNNEISTTMGEARVKEITEENLLGITFCQSLSSKQRVRALCKKAGQKVHVLARISRYMDTGKLLQLMRAFVLSQFSYCPLVWMFYDRTLDNIMI